MNLLHRWAPSFHEGAKPRCTKFECRTIRILKLLHFPAVLQQTTKSNTGIVINYITARLSIVVVKAAYLESWRSRVHPPLWHSYIKTMFLLREVQTAWDRISNSGHWITVTSNSSHHPQEVSIAQFRMCVHHLFIHSLTHHAHIIAVLLKYRNQHIYTFFYNNTPHGEQRWTVLISNWDTLFNDGTPHTAQTRTNSLLINEWKPIAQLPWLILRLRVLLRGENKCLGRISKYQEMNTNATPLASYSKYFGGCFPNNAITKTFKY